MNRVWQQLFGVGIVQTSDNFGLSGARPTHPELLDWLAAEFLRQGWRLKPMLRLVMTSAVYQQSSVAADIRRLTSKSEIRNPEPETEQNLLTPATTIDPDNHLLWRQRLRRLDAEMIRDALLVVSGKLDPTTRGPPVPIESRPDGLVIIKDKDCPTLTSKWRRSVYVLARRNYQLSILSTFDQPAMSMNCTRRMPSAVVAQSLTMLNDPFVLEQASFLAQRIANETADADDARHIERAFELMFARKPDAEELGWCADFLERQIQRHEAAKLSRDDARQKALMNLCHTLVNGSEFLYEP